MPAMIRPNKECLKLYWEVMKVPKDKRQDPQRRPSQKIVKQWFRDSSQAQ
jgi:hypothetical protein